MNDHQKNLNGQIDADTAELHNGTSEDKDIIGTKDDICEEPTVQIEETISTGPEIDGGWGWAVAVGTFLVIFFTGGFLKSSGVLYIKFLEKFEQKAVTTAWVFSLLSTVHLVPAPIASGLSERYSCRSVVYFGTALSFVGMLISTYVQTIYPLYVTFSIVVGFGKCLMYTSSLIILTKYFTKRRGLATGIAAAGGGVGVMAFPPFIEWLFTLYDYRGAMFILSGLTLETFICGAIFRPIEKHKRMLMIKPRQKVTVLNNKSGVTDSLLNPRDPGQQARVQEKKKSSDIKSEDQSSSANSRLSKLKTFFSTKDNTKKKLKLIELSLLKDFLFLSLCVATFTYTMSLFITLVFVPPLAKSKGISDAGASWIVSIMGLSDTIARILAGFIFDLSSVKPYRLLVYNFVLYGLGIVSMTVPIVSSFHGFTAIAITYGVLMGCYTSQKTVIVVDVIGVEKMAASFGLLLLFQGVGSLIGPTFSGLFKDTFGGYNEGFYMGGIGLFVGASLFMCANIYRIVRKGHKDVDNSRSITVE